MTDCWLTLEDELASRYHARLHAGDDGLSLEDLDSRNGTFVNDEQVRGKIWLRDGDKIRIGRETIAVLGANAAGQDDDDSFRHTLSGTDDGRFPALMSQLVDKSLKIGKLKDAERYALALTNQLSTSPVGVDHPAAHSCVRCLLALVERTSEGVWIDRLFRLYATQAWLMQEHVVEEIRGALDRVPRVTGNGILEYERRLRQMIKSGVVVPSSLQVAIAEFGDAYSRG